jgi:hypothetical protein
MDQGCFECGRASEMTHGILSKHYFTPARAQVFFKKMPETGSTRDKYFMMLLCAFDFCFGKLCDGPTSGHTSTYHIHAGSKSHKIQTWGLLSSTTSPFFPRRGSLLPTLLTRRLGRSPAALCTWASCSSAVRSRSQ